MSDTIQIDDKQIRKFIFHYTNTLPKNIMPKVARGFLNDLAFETKENSKKTIEKNFSIKNNSTRRYLTSAVNVKKVKGTSNINSMVSEVGVLSGKQDTRKYYKRHILVRQELGGEVKQVKGSGKGFRKQLVVPTRNVDPKKIIKFKKSGIVSTPKGIVGKKRQMAASLKLARTRSKKYAVTPYGIYRVYKRKAEYVRSFHEKDTIRTSKDPWLKPANKLTEKKIQRFFKKNLLRQLKKHKIR